MNTKIIAFYYKVLLTTLNLRVDYRLRERTRLGVSPYIRRSILILIFLNIQELYRAINSPRFSRKLHSQTKALKNSKLGKTALILGNGPSLSKLNAAEVKRDKPDIWVVNDFFRVEALKDLDISFYVLSDLAYLVQKTNEDNRLLNSIIKHCKEMNVTFVLPHWFTSYDKNGIFGEKPTHYFDDRELSAWTRNIKPTKPRGYVSLTLYKALAYAIFMGYEKIYILGMDNTQFMAHTSDSKNRIILKGNHAYSSAHEVTDLSEHFLDGMAGAFTAYAHAFGDLRKFSGPIYNLDVDSLTNAFPKVLEHPWLFWDS
jgi:hypothetical protein